MARVAGIGQAVLIGVGAGLSYATGGWKGLISFGVGILGAYAGKGLVGGLGNNGQGGTGISKDKVANIEPDEEFASPNISGKIRGVDPEGDGAFMAPRKGGGHAGIDVIARPGEAVMAPFDGTVTQVGSYKGMSTVHVASGRFYSKLLYLRGVNVIVGTAVTKGQVIALSADMATAYGAGMANHVHFQVQLTSDNKFIDPTGWISP